MASKSKNHSGTGALKKSGHVIIGKINKDLSHSRQNSTSLNPLLMPEKIKGPKGNAVKSLPYDILDMKSKKLITSIDESLTNLSSVNPLEEGGFGYDHPAVKTKKIIKKKADSFPQSEAVENIDEYAAVLFDLKMVMKKLAANREEIFNTLSKKN